MAEQPEIKISASKLKTFQSCSFLYYAKYVLKLPDTTNVGAQQGTEVHSIFECLLNPRHKKLYDAIVKAPSTITNAPSVEHHVRAYIKKHGLPDESFNKIDAMVVVGLCADFFCKGGELMKPEFAFNLKSDKPKYNITGLMDKLAIYNKKFIRISDFKSSKKKFEGDELKINVQAMMYSLAAKKLWPELIPIVDFIFLQFPDDPIQRLKFSDSQLRGFELFLGDIAKQMANFDLKAATGNMASKKPFPEAGQGFQGRLLCGFAKYPGQLKKDGTPMWGCSMKFPFDYYALCNDDGDVVKSAFENSFKPDKSKGEFVVKKRYAGCPGHKQ